MKRILIPVMVLLASTAARGALAELNVAEGTIMAPDGSFSGRDFSVVPGFKLELLYKANTATEGQWVAIGWDDKHRLLVPSYSSDKLARLTIPNVGSNEPVKVEMVTTTQVGAAEGVLAAFGGVYIDTNRSNTMRSGVYKLTDTNGDDKLDTTHVIYNRQGSGDHGTHTLQLTPDGTMISLISGNATVPAAITRSKVPLDYGEDNLVMRMDLSPPGFHRAPDGNIINLSPDGSIVEQWNIGMRNPVSMAYNKDGELFVYDADEEPNMGFTVAYRPTDIEHAISGSDHGWRAGSKVHPYWYFDYFSPIGVVGSGSPVGSAFGTGTKFPARYQDAFYAGDWSFGNLWAVSIIPDGSSYKAEPQPFVSGRPFPVSGITVNKQDGSLIMETTGTELYRVTYVGSEDTTPTKPDDRFKAARDTRHDIEKYDGNKNSGAVQALWQYLGDQDRGIRYAARTALEWQDVAQWQNRALDEKDPRKAIGAIASLARVSHRDQYHTVPGSPAPDKALEERMLASLDRISPSEITFVDKLDLLRAYHLVLIRMGQPSAATRQRIISKFDPMLPGQYQEQNRMIAELLAYLQAPSAATKMMALIDKAPDNPYFGIQEWINPQQRQRQDRGGFDPSAPNVGISQAQIAKQDAQIFYAQLLRTVTAGWTPDLRKQYMEYFVTAPAGYYGSLAGLNIIRTDAVSLIPDNEKGSLADIIAKPMPTGMGRATAGIGGVAAPAPVAAAAPAAAAGGRGRGGRGGAAAPAAGAPAAGAAAPAGGGGGRGGNAGPTPGLNNPEFSLYVKPGGANRAFSDAEVTMITKYEESFTKEQKAWNDANDALAKAPFIAPATISARVNDLANAELALANARAANFAKLKAEMKPNADQLRTLPRAIASHTGGAIQITPDPNAPAPAAPAGRGP